MVEPWEPRVSSLEIKVGKVESDLAEIKVKMQYVSTREDVSIGVGSLRKDIGDAVEKLRSEFNKQVIDQLHEQNATMQKALDAQPANRTAIGTWVSALAMIAAVMVSVIALVLHFTGTY